MHASPSEVEEIWVPKLSTCAVEQASQGGHGQDPEAAEIAEKVWKKQCVWLSRPSCSSSWRRCVSNENAPLASEALISEVTGCVARTETSSFARNEMQYSTQGLRIN